MNIPSIKNKRLLLKKRDSKEFMFSLETVTFYCKKILQLIIESNMWSLILLSSNS